MKCFVCDGVVTEISLGEDGEEHLFECKNCDTKTVTTNKDSYCVAVEKLTSTACKHRIVENFIQSDKFAWRCYDCGHVQEL